MHTGVLDALVKAKTFSVHEESGIVRAVDKVMHFITLLSPSAPKLKTVILRFKHSSTMYLHLGSKSSAENLLSVPKQAKHMGGTFWHKGCAM